MDDTRGSETPGEMLARRLADAVGPGSQIDERAATEENELICLLGNQSLTAPLPSAIPEKGVTHRIQTFFLFLTQNQTVTSVSIRVHSR